MSESLVARNYIENALLSDLLDSLSVAPPVSGCTCPSGDGSLRWPCPVHPPEANHPPAYETLTRLYDLFGIGKRARTPAALICNVENTRRFAEYLHAIEREFFMVPGEPDEDYPDEEPAAECLVNCWGSTKEQYIEQFREALKRITPPAASPVPDDITDLIPRAVELADRLVSPGPKAWAVSASETHEICDFILTVAAYLAPSPTSADKDGGL